jgi:hypothetical protein
MDLDAFQFFGPIFIVKNIFVYLLFLSSYNFFRKDFLKSQITEAQNMNIFKVFIKGINSFEQYFLCSLERKWNWEELWAQERTNVVH